MSPPPRAASTQWTAEHGNWHVTAKTVWQYSKPLIVNISEAIILWFALARASARNYQLLNSPRWPIFSINLWKKQSLYFTTSLTLHHSFFRNLPPLFIFNLIANKRHIADQIPRRGRDRGYAKAEGTTKILERVIPLLSHAKHYMNYTFPCCETKVA